MIFMTSSIKRVHAHISGIRHLFKYIRNVYFDTCLGISQNRAGIPNQGFAVYKGAINYFNPMFIRFVCKEI